MTHQTSVLLNEALASHLETVKDGDRQTVQQELGRFIRWCGRDRDTGSLTPVEIEEYCGTLEGGGDQSSRRLAITKGFLAYLHRRGQTSVNLAPHARLRRTGQRKASASRQARLAAASQLTPEGFKRLQDELAALKGERGKMVEEIRLAAATKDFSENAPLDAAREHQGQVEARIRELEVTLEGATLLKEKRADVRATVGSRVVLRQTQTGREVSYLLVESREADPAAGKLSASSPVGKAMLDHAQGDEVEVMTPRGAIRYLVTKVGN